MKKVKDTKYPTIKQMSSMTENLREHLDTYVSIDITANAYNRSDEICIEYKIYIESAIQCFHTFDSWKTLLHFYHKLMEENIGK